ncbi:tetratricopeptide repeat protein [Pseudomonas sp. UYIF39]|uniref:tetratricopeptide repeat protein n=1 Tax=Pseudomonas sp. UYIF39 TaxID=1630747 RepID=UPI00249EA450|nr:tetratricopeptide repeat protein [Pseudomonas sp. UYIF39]MDI3356975.1 tetratricopeptide repeat protein [Pseudomonas sp. UYIF39]
MGFVQKEQEIDNYSGAKISEGEEIIISAYCKALVRGKHLPTVVAFSSVNTPKGNFKPYKTILDTKFNIVFVNDSGNNWYLKGVEGVGANFTESAKKIIEIARGIGNGWVMTFGTSMGAYGSMLYAAVGGADKCVAFGPEVMLDQPGSRSHQHKSKDAFLSYSTLLSYVKNSTSIFYLITSESDEVDLINAIAFTNISNVKVFSIRGVEHPGVQVFDAEIGIGKFIDAAINDTGSIMSFERAGTMLENKELIKDLWIAYGLKREKNFIGYLDYLLSIRDGYLNSSMYMLRLGEAYYRTGNYRRATECLKKSIDLDSLQFESYNLLGVIQRKQKIYPDSESNLLESAKISPRNPYPHHNLGLLYLDLGLLDKALLVFERAVALNKGNAIFAKSLADVKALING